MVNGVKGKFSGTKIKLIIVAIIAVMSIYSYFAYQREFFPFTKENKAKIQKMIKGKGGKSAEEEEEAALRKQLEEELGGRLEDEEGLVDKYGNLEEPRGGTGGIDLSGAGGLKNPAIKGDEQMTAQYQQELFRQLFLPYEDYEGGTPGSQLTGNFMPIARGGDIPTQNELGNLTSPIQYPFPIDERLYDLYGLYPPGGTYRPELGDYPYYWGYPPPPDEDDEDDDEANSARRINAMLARNRKAKLAKGTKTRKVAYIGDTMTPGEQQFAFSRLQHKATRMNRLNDPPVVRKGNLANTLPPIVARRHMATDIRLS